MEITFGNYIFVGSIIGGIFAVALLFIMWADKNYIEEAKRKFSKNGTNLATIFTGAVIVNILVWPVIISFLLTKIGWKLWTRLSKQQK